jgi:uncharacterized protein (DUF2147 family)
MRIKFLFSLSALLLLTIIISKADTVPPCEQICGKWESSEKNLVVQVYMQRNKFIAKIVWFSDTAGRHMDYWKDVRNPDPTLRSRRILGMNVLENLTYQADTNTWEDGMIYDSKHGRDWNASAYIDKNGLLRVKGYWHFKFIGRTMTFKRVT